MELKEILNINHVINGSFVSLREIPACEDCSLPDKEGKGMKVAILPSFQSR